jgi:hypothetical protein
MLAIPLRATLLALALAAVLPGCLKVPTDLAEGPRTKAAPSTAAEVLSRHVRALGGEKKLRAVAQRTIEARMVFRPEEGCEPGDEGCVSEEQTGSFLLHNTAGGKLYRRTVVGEIAEERGFDGERGWRMQGGVLVVEDEFETARSREDAALHWYFDLKDRGVQVTLVRPRDEDFDGKARVLDGLRWEMQGGKVPPKTLWFERQTGLLAAEVMEEDVGDDTLRQTIIYEEYQPIDETMVSHRIRVIQELGPRSQEVEFVTQRVHHEPVDEKVFLAPELPTPERAPDERLAALAAAREAAAAQPKDAQTVVGHARAAWIAAHFDEAIEAANATLALDAREPEALFILARAHLLEGNLRSAEKTLRRAARAGVKKEVIALQRAWIHSRRREYSKLAKALDDAGNPSLAGRYRSFAGKPLRVSMPGKQCAAVVPLAIRKPLVAVEIVVGGESVRAMLDTGAADVILGDDLATSLGVVPQARTPMGGGVEVGHGQVPEIRIGDARIRNVPVDTFPAQSISDMAGEAGAGVRAVLGMRMLAPFQVTVDVNAGTLELVRRTSRCESERRTRRTGRAVPFWVHETHFLYVRAELNGAEGLYLVNTGMRGATVTGTRLAYGHAGIGTPPLRRGEMPMVSVPSVALAENLRAENVPGAYGVPEQTETADGFRLDGMLGLDLLSRWRWTIDFDERRFYLSGGEAAASGS